MDENKNPFLKVVTNLRKRFLIFFRSTSRSNTKVLTRVVPSILALSSKGNSDCPYNSNHCGANSSNPDVDLCPRISGFHDIQSPFISPKLRKHHRKCSLTKLPLLGAHSRLISLISYRLVVPRYGSIYFFEKDTENYFYFFILTRNMFFLR